MTTLTTWSPVDAAVAAVDDLAPDQLAEILKLPELKILTNEFRAGEADLGGSLVKTLHCTASSTIVDLHGDTMTQDCVLDMARQARKGLTIFLNHKYAAPEDVAGKVYQASAANSTEKDENGLDIWDLHYDISLTRNNPRVDQMYAQVKEDGIRLGVSIGAYILEYDFKNKEEGFWGGLIINKVLLVETSIVGIPANQRSWVQNGVMAIGKFLGLRELFDSDEPEFRLEKRLWKVLDGKSPAPLLKIAASTCPDCGGSKGSPKGGCDNAFHGKADEPETTKADWDTAYVNSLPDSAFACIEPGGKKDDEGKTTPRSKRHYPHHDKSGKVDEPHVNAALSRIADKSNYQCDGGEAHLKAHKGGKSHEHMSVEELVLADHLEETAMKTASITVATAPVIKTDTESDEPEAQAEDETQAGADAAPEPESTDEQQAEETTEETEGEASVTETALTEVAPEVALSLEAGDTPAIEIVLAALESAAVTLRTIRAEKATLEATMATLTGERDQAIKDRDDAFEIIERIARTPLGRKTQFVEPIQSFQARFGHLYDKGFLKLIDETE